MYRLSCCLSVLSFVAFSSVVFRGEGSFTAVGPQTRSVHVDPECYMNSSQLITDNGYLPETHTVTTKDGYILQIFRVKPKKGKFKAEPTKGGGYYGGTVLSSS